MRNVDELLAAEAATARKKMEEKQPPVQHPERWLVGWFNALAADYPHVRTIENRARFISLALKPKEGES